MKTAKLASDTKRRLAISAKHDALESQRTHAETIPGVPLLYSQALKAGKEEKGLVPRTAEMIFYVRRRVFWTLRRLPGVRYPYPPIDPTAREKIDLEARQAGEAYRLSFPGEDKLPALSTILKVGTHKCLDLKGHEKRNFVRGFVFWALKSPKSYSAPTSD